MKTKAEIMAALTAAGVTGFDESWTVAKLQELAAEKGVSLEKTKPIKPTLVDVKALVHIAEDGVSYKPEDIFQVTEERLEALGTGLVQRI